MIDNSNNFNNLQFNVIYFMEQKKWKNKLKGKIKRFIYPHYWSVGSISNVFYRPLILVQSNWCSTLPNSWKIKMFTIFFWQHCTFDHQMHCFYTHFLPFWGLNCFWTTPYSIKKINQSIQLVKSYKIIFIFHFFLGMHFRVLSRL